MLSRGNGVVGFEIGGLVWLIMEKGRGVVVGVV